MNIMDSFISRFRKIDNNKHFQIVDIIKLHKWREFASDVTGDGDIVIILDPHGLYQEDISSMNGLYVEVQSVGVGKISIDYPSKPNDEDINMEDFQIIWIGF
jgi:hypothetical protein